MEAQYEIRNGEAPAPVSRRRGRSSKGSKYPFEHLAVDQYFFVPFSSEEKPAQDKQQRNMSQAYQAVRKRHSTRKFKVYVGVENDVNGLVGKRLA